MNTSTTNTLSSADTLALRVYAELGGHTSQRARSFADIVRLCPDTGTCGSLVRRVQGVAAGFGVRLS